MEGPQTTWEHNWHTLSWEGRNKYQATGESKPVLKTWPGRIDWSPLLEVSHCSQPLEGFQEM